MKIKTIVSLFCAMLGFAASRSVMAASEKDDSFTVSGEVTLTESKTVGYLDIKSGATLDLNGYDLTVEHGSETVSATIKNSSATLSHISFTPYESNGWGAQFQNNLKFEGNLELIVCGIVNSNNTWSQKGFQDAVNTHTGGTVLDGYGVNSSEDGIYLPRINNTTFCGSGPLTLKNGATLMFTGSENTTFAFSKIVFEGGTDERPNWFKSDRSITITSPIESANASDVLHLTIDPGKNMLLQGDISGVKGVIRTKPKGNGTIQFQQASDGMPDGVLRLFLHDANTDASVRYSGAGTEFCLGGLETDPSITGPNAHARIQKTVEGDNVTLKVGSANRDNVFYGKIQRDASNKDWNVEKVGTGTWTLAAGDHSYEGTTTLTEGTLKFAGAGKIATKSNIIFNGGTLELADDSTLISIANTIVAEDAPFKLKIPSGKEMAFSTTISRVTKGIVLSGGGKMTLSALPLESGATIDIQDGSELVLTSLGDVSTSHPVYVTNSSSSEAVSTLTLSGSDISDTKFKGVVLSGNVRLVTTGNSAKFRDTSDKIDDKVVDNTHTGGTVISNLTNQTRFYSPGNFGKGPIVMHNSSMMRPSNNLGDTNFSNPWEFYGNNSMELQTWANNTHSVNLNGPWSGDGSIYISNGWYPTIELNGDMGNFEGTLKIAYKENETSGFWMRGDNTNGLPKATLIMANVTSLTSDKWFTHLKVKPGNNATVTHDSNLKFTSFPIGHLITDGDDADDYQNSYIMNCTQWANSEWEIGALNESGTFAGWFTQEKDNAHLKITKVGTGTWTWTSSLHTFDGPLTVAAGRMNINSANLTNCAVVVKSGATLGGTGTLSDKAAVTVEAGGILAGSLTLSAGVTFQSGSIISATDMTVNGTSDFSNGPLVKLDPDTFVAGETYTILTSESMPGNALLHEDMTNQIAGVYLTQANNVLSLVVPANVVGTGATVTDISAASEADALKAVAIKLTETQLAAGLKSSYYKKVATETSSGVWTVGVALDEEAVKVELSNTTWTADTANGQITFTIAPESLKVGLYYGVATGTAAGACTCSSYSQYKGARRRRSSLPPCRPAASCTTPSW